MSDLQVFSLADCNNVRIMLDQPYDPEVFFIKPASANDDHYWMRDLPYIQVISEPEQAEDSAGRVIRSTTLKDGRFTVVPLRFCEQAQAFLHLKRHGIKWTINKVNGMCNNNGKECLFLKEFEK